jgi:hypothetical protein
MRLGDARFFNLFALLASASNPARTSRWKVAGVTWTRSRVSHASPDHGCQIEIHTLCHAGRDGWILLSAQESWWDGARRDPFRNGRWVHLTSGKRADVLRWFTAREAELEAPR